MSAPVAVSLVHWPVLNKLGEIVCTNVTNLDVHDIGRACTTFGVQKYYIVNRMQDQRLFVDRLQEHWQQGRGAKFNEMRKTALGRVYTVDILEKAKEEYFAELRLSGFTGQLKLIATSARQIDGLKQVGFSELKQRFHSGNEAFMLVFGTGYGLSNEILKYCDEVLEPIRGATPEDYRHLSVRSAVTICLDRLIAAW